MPGFGAFDGNAFDDDAFDTDIFEAVTPPVGSWSAIANQSTIWTPITAPTISWTSEEDDGF